jgi:aprataxin
MKRLQKQEIVIKKNAFDLMKQAATKTLSDSNKTLTTSKNNNKSKPAFFLSLEESMRDESVQVFRNERFVCIKDKFPKSNYHLLLIPLFGKEREGDSKGKKSYLSSVEELLRLDNYEMILKEMNDLSLKIIKEIVPTKEMDQFKIGFHSIQSMYPLHLHIISNDFSSIYLKTKKHWNSFNTQYFIDLEKLSNLDLKSKILNRNKSDIEDELKLPLKCNKCDSIAKNMPTLKKHLEVEH